MASATGRHHQDDTSETLLVVPGALLGFAAFFPLLIASQVALEESLNLFQPSLSVDKFPGGMVLSCLLAMATTYRFVGLCRRWSPHFAKGVFAGAGVLAVVMLLVSFFMMSDA